MDFARIILDIFRPNQDLIKSVYKPREAIRHDAGKPTLFTATPTQYLSVHDPRETNRHDAMKTTPSFAMPIVQTPTQTTDKRIYTRLGMLLPSKRFQKVINFLSFLSSSPGVDGFCSSETKYDGRMAPRS